MTTLLCKAKDALDARRTVDTVRCPLPRGTASESSAVVEVEVPELLAEGLRLFVLACDGVDKVCANAHTQTVLAVTQAHPREHTPILCTVIMVIPLITFSHECSSTHNPLHSP